MPTEYLKQIKRSALPLVETNQANIDKLRMLSAAGMVEVDLPAIDAPEQIAIVRRIKGLNSPSVKGPVTDSSDEAPSH